MTDYTAADLGITGPHLVAHAIDGDHEVVLEVEGYYHSGWPRSRWVRYLKRHPGIDANTTSHAPLDRLEVVTP